MPGIPKKLFNRLVPVLLIIAFTMFGIISLLSIRQVQGDARVINYAGLARGATQRLIKQEMNQVQNDDMIEYLDTLLHDLSQGGGDYNLTALNCQEFQCYIGQMQTAWAELKTEINEVRNGKSADTLYIMSEEYFTLADLAVSSAESHSENKVRNTAYWIMALNLVLVIFVILIWVFNRLQKSMASALQAAENKSREKSEFLSRMSHEIRTPMNGIIGMTELAKLNLHDSAKAMDCLDKISLSSDYLLSLINDILDMSRIESGKFILNTDAFSLEEFRKKLYVMFQQKAEELGISFTVESKGEEEYAVTGDELRLSQVVVNIVSNALKFTPKGGTVRVTIQQNIIGENLLLVRFIIKDTGIGMSEEFTKRMFEPFEQENAVAGRNNSGTGLGLSISYNLIKLMGGSITLDSEPGEGSCFTVAVELPLAERSSSAFETKETGSEAVLPEGIHILLAEDNEINWELTKDLLENVGITSDHAWNGREAVDMFIAAPKGFYDLILMDVQMPEMDGLAACRAIRAMGGSYAGNIPIVGLSANAFEQDIRLAIAGGMSGYLSKPFNIRQLKNLIAGLV